MKPNRDLSAWIWNCIHIDDMTKATIMPLVRGKEEIIAQLEARLASARAIMQRFVNKVDDIDKDEMIDVEDICVEMKEWLDSDG